jgi:hypothetical protein
VRNVTSAFDQVLSGDYEYRADRWWADGPRLVFVGCNPSMITWQDAPRLDPTSAKCEAIAQREGYAGVTMLNLWALRGTDPRALRDHADPIGPGWAEAFEGAVHNASLVAAWGTPPFAAGVRIARPRIAEVLDRLAGLGLNVRCLGETSEGHPRHASLRGVAMNALPALQPYVGRRTRPYTSRPWLYRGSVQPDDRPYVRFDLPSGLRRPPVAGAAARALDPLPVPQPSHTSGPGGAGWCS